MHQYIPQQLPAGAPILELLHQFEDRNERRAQRDEVPDCCSIRLQLTHDTALEAGAQEDVSISRQRRGCSTEAIWRVGCVE